MEEILARVTEYKDNKAKEIIYNLVLAIFALGFLTLGLLAMILYQSWVRGIIFFLFFPILLYIMIKGLVERNKIKKWFNSNVGKPLVSLVNNKKLRFYGIKNTTYLLTEIYQIGYYKNSITVVSSNVNLKRPNVSSKSTSFTNIENAKEIVEKVTDLLSNNQK